MSARKARTPARPYDAYKSATPPQPRKKSRGPRVRLTHFEVRRGEALRLRLAVADDVLADVGDELGALIKRIAPSTQAASVAAVEAASVPVEVTDVVVSREHVEHDSAYHEGLREHLTALFGSLCDTALQDALDIAREERDRRSEGGN